MFVVILRIRVAPPIMFCLIFPTRIYVTVDAYYLRGCSRIGGGEAARAGAASARADAALGTAESCRRGAADATKRRLMPTNAASSESWCSRAEATKPNRTPAHPNLPRAKRRLRGSGRDGQNANCRCAHSPIPFHHNVCVTRPRRPCNRLRLQSHVRDRSRSTE